MNHAHKKYLLALSVSALMYQAAADVQTVSQLESIKVTSDKVKTQGKLGERVLGKRQLAEENIQNAQDLVRYNTEVDVAEVGRYGNKGFAVRGVDGNRVAMNIDGMPLPNVEANELFLPYGYVYEGRFNPDIEMMGSVRIHAGADSVASGSGAVGGAVSFRTREPFHLSRGEGVGGYAKMGYTNKNSELLSAVGVAGKQNNVDFLFNYAHRVGHELKNHDMRAFDAARLNDIEYDFEGKGELGIPSQRSSALYPDSQHYKKHAALAKAYYHLGETQRLGVSAFYQKRTNDIHAFSQSNTGAIRKPKDKEEMKSYGINHRFTPNDHAFLERVESGYQYQDILGLADTWLYAGFPKRVLSSREYRPTRTKAHQFKLDGVLMPMDWGKLGIHQPKLELSYGKQDFTSTSVHVNYKDNQITHAIQPYVIYFPDAKKDIVNLVVQDDVRFDNGLGAKLGLRYDYYQYRPYFQNDTWFGDIQSNERHDLQANINNPRLQFYEDYRNGVYDKSAIFNHLTYSAAFDYKINDGLTARYKAGTGFLAPTVNQMYSAFQGLGAQQIINTKLKPETSVNHELELEWHKNLMAITTSLYHSQYKNFIHATYWQSDDKPALSARLGCRSGMTCIQSQNLNTAKIDGVKLGVRGDVSKWLTQGNRLYLTADFHHAKDEATVVADQPEDGVLKINTLAAVPKNAILGLDYHYQDKLSLYLKGRFNAAKKPEETKYVQTLRDNSRKVGYRETVATYRHLERGKDTWVIDLYGSYKINPQLSITAGVYNLTNVRYIPWENLRQFGHISTNSPIDGEGYGFNRYTAPARNYALAVNYEF